MSHSKAESPEALSPSQLPDDYSSTVKPVEIFYSYAHEDEKLRNELQKHLANLKRQRVITEWYDRDISAGSEWGDQIAQHLNSASVILLLISPDFMNSDYSNDVEVKRAMQRHEAGEAKVIPIILRPVDWEGAPFSKLQAYPEDAKAVVLWDNHDDAFLNVVKGIRRALRELATGPDGLSAALDIKPEAVVSNPRLITSTRARNWLRRFAGWAFIGAATAMVQIGEFLVAEGLLILALSAFAVQIYEWSGHIERKWLERVMKTLWVAAVILLIVFFGGVFYKQKGSKPWTNLISNPAVTPTPMPTPTLTPTPTPTPAVTPTPDGTPKDPTSGVNPRPRKRPTPDPDVKWVEDKLNRNKNNAHASATQQSARITKELLKEILARRNLNAKALAVLAARLRARGVDFLLTPQVESEIRAHARDFGNTALDDVIDSIRKNDWRQSGEAKRLESQMTEDIDQLRAEFKAITDLTDLGVAIDTYNDLVTNVCVVMFTRVDNQTKRFGLETDYHSQWRRYQKPWKRDRAEYEDLRFKQWRDGTIEYLVTLKESLETKLRKA